MVISPFHLLLGIITIYTVGNTASATLSWAATTGAIGYNVKRATTVGGPYTTIATNIAELTYTDNGLTNGTTYYYVVSAVNVGGESPDSSEVSATPQIPAPGAPTNVTASSGNTQVSITWDAVTGSVGYNVKRAATTGGPYTTIATNITELTYTDTGLTNGTTYYYVVSALNTTGESPNSNEASATPQTPAPGAPTNLTATAGDAQIALSWIAVAGSAGYNVKRATTAGGPYTTIANNVTETTFTDTGLTNGTTYYYMVSALNATGESADSNEASATPQGTVAQSNRAILVLTMTDNSEREYDLPMDEVTDFLQWYDARSNGIGRSYFALSKAFISGPFSNRKDYVPFDKIYSFEVMEYTK